MPSSKKLSEAETNTPANSEQEEFSVEEGINLIDEDGTFSYGESASNRANNGLSNKTSSLKIDLFSGNSYNETILVKPGSVQKK